MTGSLPLVGSLLASTDAVEIVEYFGPLEPPAHVHREHDEVFHVLAGAFTFTLDGQETIARRGDTVVVPRGTRHSFNVGEGGRALLVIAPGGLAGFLRELGQAVAAGESSDAIRSALAGRYDSYPS